MNWIALKYNFIQECTDNNQEMDHFGHAELRPNFVLNPLSVFEWFKKKIEGDKRTLSQNNALHKYFDMIAKQLNEIGLTFNYKNPIGMVIDIPWTMQLVKDNIWRPIQIVLFGVKSTKNLKKVGEIDQIISILDKHFAEKGMDIEFPSFQSFLNKIDCEKF